MEERPDGEPRKAQGGPLREGRDFFELEPEEMSTWSQPGPVMAVPRRRNVKRISGIVLAASVLAVFILLLVLLWPSSSVRVPDLVGRDLDSALGAARGSGLRPRVVKWEFSFRYPDGVVVAQEPPKGRVAARGSELLLTVSKGEERSGSRATPSGRETQTGGSLPGRPAEPLSEKTVCVDPGYQAVNMTPEHTDPGMTSKKLEKGGEQKGVGSMEPEHKINLDIALKLKGLLEKDGINVVMTRETNGVDVSNITRAEIANNANADLFVRIFCSGSPDGSVRGTATLYPAKNEWTREFYDASKTAAIYVQEGLVRLCGTEDLGIEPRGDVAGFNWSEVPVVMAMVGYLTNPDDDALLNREEFRSKAARGLRNGIVRYFRSL